MNEIELVRRQQAMCAVLRQELEVWENDLAETVHLIGCCGGCAIPEEYCHPPEYKRLSLSRVQGGLLCLNRQAEASPRIRRVWPRKKVSK